MASTNKTYTATEIKDAIAALNYVKGYLDARSQKHPADVIAEVIATLSKEKQK